MKGGARHEHQQQRPIRQSPLLGVMQASACAPAALVVLPLVIDQVIDFTTIMGSFLIAFMGIQVGYRVVYLRMIQGDKTALKYQGYFERPDQAERDAAFATRMGKYSHQPGNNGAPLPEPADDPPVQSQ